MLEQPWPPAGPGPQQPRDAHRQHWANDACRRPPLRGVGTPSSGPDGWGERPGREPAVRRRADHAQRHDGDERDRGERTGRDGVRGPGGPARDGQNPDRAQPSPARWVPAEAWIPDPKPAPERRWSPEQDWLAAFADRREAAVPPLARPHGATRRRVAVGAAVLALGAALAVALVALL
ncbi:MAG: hypothetical protein IR158_09515 [Cellulomonas sp.]|uniref:hypothetical protein n=1 Tax=Cellulomonas sp. TaxID=40001 RepID=UPI0019F9E98F|nr:hypothetical protein [Cellulomonas sp.]MBF0687987.1 hypothetical protein [Cellulomonas sp.]